MEEGRNVAHRRNGGENGKRKNVGPLSRTAAWKAGCFWEEKKGDAKVFLEKGGEKIEVSVEKLIGKDGPRFWFKNKPELPEQQPEKGWKTSLSPKMRLMIPPPKRRPRS